jgi:hypothetical protein
VTGQFACQFLSPRSRPHTEATLIVADPREAVFTLTRAVHGRQCAARARERLKTEAVLVGDGSADGAGTWT